MCVLFGPEVVIKNAFAAQENTKPYIELDALRKFCDILFHHVSQTNSGAGRYKYVCFQLDREDLEEFCEEDGQFINGINRIYMTKAVDKAGCTCVNAVYAKEIRDSLDAARNEFAACTNG